MNIKIEKNYPIADETTFKIGGPAEFFVAAHCRHQLEDAVREAKKMSVPVTVLGGGSNVLISSDGVDGLVIKLRSGEIEFLSKAENLIRVGAGVSLPRLSGFALKESFTGLEWAAGVPGSLGGAVYGNAGAFGQSIADVIEEVEVLRGDERLVLSKDEIDFSYRNSTFKKEDLTILSASLKLGKGEKSEIKKRVDKFLKYRNNNHPMDIPCAGSIFKNPETKIEDPKLIEKYPLLKNFNEKGVQSAGYLIESVGLKGFALGGAMFSQKHANFIVNKNGASSEDVRDLIKKAKEEVFERFGVGLEKEVRFINVNN